MAWFPDSFTCEGCGERVDVGDCPNCTKPEPAPAPRPPSLRIEWGVYQVIEVMVEQDCFMVLNSFGSKVEAQGLANRAHELQNCFRLIYEGGRFVGGVCWKPTAHEMWERAQQIVERAFVDAA